ncbi:MAG: methylenetetrahydrofolate reductase [Treponema sp.]|jgi:methylenetetrahydrofolate reductase (NADPH)|nr:methylenetetrahydrofolate reductase [Treponema sp.]
MRIAEILKKKMTVSFEVFPPKEDDGVPKLQKEIDICKKYNPDFISCTYGAGGTNKGKSVEVCSYVQKQDINCMTHYTCIMETEKSIDDNLKEYASHGLENILALRGDYRIDPATGKPDIKTGGAFHYATQLVDYIHKKHPNYCIACAGDPEIHTDARSAWSDMAFMRIKQDAGAEFCLAQTCHDVEAYEKWIKQLRHAGFHLPVVLGVMPALNARFTEGGPNISALTMIPNESAIPRSLAAIIGKYTAPRGASPEVAKQYADDFRKAGKEWTVNQIHKFMCCDVQGIHLYTLNKAADAADIVEWSGLRSSPEGKDTVHRRPTIELGNFF